MSRAEFDGQLRRFPRAVANLKLRTVLDQAASGCQPILGVASDAKSYWCKLPDNPHGIDSVAAERIVAAAGKLISAPVRMGELIQVGELARNYSYGDGRRMQPGIAHGSLLLDPAQLSADDHVLPNVRLDGNAQRYLEFLALWDWCMGTDIQWLFDSEEDMKVWTFDHGLWLGGESGWTDGGISLAAPRSYAWAGSTAGVDFSGVKALAVKLESVTPEDTLRAVSSVPAEWPIADADLELVAWVLYERRIGTARRLLEMATKSDKFR